MVGVEPTSLNLAQGSAGTRGAVLFRPISGHNYIPDPRLRSVLGCIGTDKFAEPFEKEKRYDSSMFYLHCNKGERGG